ncbi:MAG: mismatch-specific DNA-glycosylase [Porticoccaceae bacterium]|nr:mismatch-specific DNA-glycosylase [Porticoccaceae bacterium]
MKTLPDLLATHLSVLSIGLNPSLLSVEAGFYFANPRNRFWKALNNCGYIPKPLEPSLDSCYQLLNQYNIGFTDLVKRPTAGCKDLNATDYREGSSRLDNLLNQLSPRIIWFHGKLTCKKYIQYSPDNKRIVNWGRQPWALNNAAVYVTPNPSPANAAYSLNVISDSYHQLFQSLQEPTTC